MWRLARPRSALRRSALLIPSRTATTDTPRREIRFSETRAYQGIDRKRFDIDHLASGSASQWDPDEYSTESYRNRKLISAIVSLTAIILWFGWLREPSDLDDILNAPPHLLSSNLERRMLREEIDRAKAAGRDTTLLEAELEYVAVKEAAMKVQFKQK